MPDIPGFIDRKCAECDLLRKRETRFQDLADLLPQIVFELDENLEFTFFNWNAIDITGYACDDLPKGTGIFDIIREADRKSVEHFFASLQQDITSGHIECGIIAHDGREIPAIIYASPVIGEKRIAGIHGVIVDISEKIQLENALEVTNRKLNLMNSVTRHDVLNNITGLLGLCDMLGDITTNSNEQELISDIRNQVIRMKELIFNQGYGKNTGFGLFIIREILGITGLAIHETGISGSGVLFEITVPKAAWRPYRGGGVQ